MESVLNLLRRISASLDRIANPSPWLTLPQAAAYVHMDPQPFRELVYRGDVESHKRSEKRIFVHTDALDELMRSYPTACRVPEELMRAS